MRVTFDTNILISATIAKGNEFKLLKLAKLEKIKLILSLDIVKEFKDVISRPKFGYSEEDVNRLTKEIINISQLVVPTIKINIVKEDPSDNKILECASTGNVDYIISGDAHLLKLKKYKNIKIIKTKKCLEILKDLLRTRGESMGILETKD